MSRSPSHRRYAQLLRQRKLTEPVASALSPVGFARMQTLRAHLEHLADDPAIPAIVRVAAAEQLDHEQRQAATSPTKEPA